MNQQRTEWSNLGEADLDDSLDVDAGRDSRGQGEHCDLVLMDELRPGRKSIPADGRLLETGDKRLS